MKVTAKKGAVKASEKEIAELMALPANLFMRENIHRNGSPMKTTTGRTKINIKNVSIGMFAADFLLNEMIIPKSDENPIQETITASPWRAIEAAAETLLSSRLTVTSDSSFYPLPSFLCEYRYGAISR